MKAIWFIEIWPIFYEEFFVDSSVQELHKCPITKKNIVIPLHVALKCKVCISDGKVDFVVNHPIQFETMYQKKVQYIYQYESYLVH